MKKAKLNTTTNAQGKAIVSQATDESKDLTEQGYDNLLTAFELDYATNGAHGCLETIYPLAIATVHSVLKTMRDPQRVRAQESDKVSNSGFNPVVDELKRGLSFDIKRLENARKWADVFCSSFTFDEDGTPHAHFNKEGDAITEWNADAMTAWEKCSEPLGEGMDMVNQMVCELLDYAERFAHTGAGWLTRSVPIVKLAKTVWRMDEDLTTKEVEKEPIQLCRTEVENYARNRGSIGIDPRDKKCYVEDFGNGNDEDGEDVALARVYRVSHIGADIGGVASPMFADGSFGSYSADYQTAMDYHTAMNRLSLTDRQLTYLRYCEKNYGEEVIAERMGISTGNVWTIRMGIAKKALAIELITAEQYALMEKRYKERKEREKQIKAKVKALRTRKAKGELVTPYKPVTPPQKPVVVTIPANLTRVKCGHISPAPSVVLNHAPRMDYEYKRMLRLAR